MEGMLVTAIYISPGHNFFGHHGRASGSHPTTSVAEVECVPGRGLRGDRFFDYKDDYKGQVTFFASEVYDSLCEALHVHHNPPGVFRRNVITRGIDLNDLVGKPIEIQGIQFLGMAECSPCAWMNEAFAPGAEALLQGRGGLRAKIITGGRLKVDRP
jgi:MOSC domain-containing protein YiiM